MRVGEKYFSCIYLIKKNEAFQKKYQKIKSTADCYVTSPWFIVSVFPPSISIYLRLSDQ